VPMAGATYGGGGRFRSPYPVPCYPDCRPDARGDYASACAAAKSTLCQLSGGDPQWCNASCPTIQTKVCTDCTVFVGNDPIRLALCCTANCPAPQAQWADPVTGQCGSTPPGGGGGDNTSLIIGLVGIAAVAGVAIAIAQSSRKKKVLVPMQRRAAGLYYR